ncbi:ABC transporter substrate-binding protein [Polyangium spumosum]|nr:ABC transporter substrate-binding protein [Polyangium spumosum]
MDSLFGGSGDVQKRNSFRRGILGVLALASGIVAATPSCSVIVDTSTKQCDEQTACPSGYTCDASNVCVASSGVTCAKTSDCANETDICRKDPGAQSGLCKPIRSPLCQVVEGDYRVDNAFVIGSIHPTTAPAPDDVIGISMENSIKLAINDLEKTANGLPNPAGQTGVREVVMVGCSDEGLEEKSVEAANHLIDNVGVQAIIGGAFSGIAIKTATEVTIPKGVLFISASGTSPSITQLADKPAGAPAGLVWRTVPSDNFQAEAIAKYVTQLENEIRAELALQASDKIKVAVLHKGDAYGTGLKDALQQNLVFNGVPAIDNGANYILSDYGNPDDVMGNPTKYGEATSAAITAGAHIVLLFGTGEAITEIFAPIEVGWNTAAYRPRYVFSDANFSGALADTVNAESNATARADWRRRTTGVVPGPQDDDPLYKSFRFSYSSIFGQGQGDPSIFGAASAYDAAYLLFYAAATVKNGVLSGQNLAVGMTKMSSAATEEAEIPAGSSALGKTLNALSDGTYESIDYSGAFGPLNFDSATGEPAANVQIFCLADDGTGKAAHQLSGEYYDADTKALAGTPAAACQ